ncbi:MAG: hypothetical protein ACOCXM_04600 [Myxococcota bacterium]
MRALSRVRGLALVAWPVVLAGGALSACGEDPPPAVHLVTFRAYQDPGIPLADVRLAIHGRELGRTDAAGELEVELRGEDGTTVPVQVTCPPGHRPTEEVLRLKLRRFRRLDPEQGEQGIQVQTECPPVERTAVVVVRAERGHDLPIRVDGRLVTHTNQQGVAHLVRTGPPGSSFEVVLDTDDRPLLKPKSPSRRFVLDDRDQILLLDQDFVEDEPKRRRRRRRRKPRPKPRRLPERIN